MKHHFTANKPYIKFNVAIKEQMDTCGNQQDVLEQLKIKDVANPCP